MARISYEGMKEYMDDVAATNEDYIPRDMKEVKLVKLGTNIKRYRDEYHGKGKRRWWK